MTKYIHMTKASLHREQDWDGGLHVRMHKDDMRAIGVRRNDWIVLTNPETGDCIYRMVRGAADAGITQGSLRLDYDGAAELDNPWVRAFYEQHGSKYYESSSVETFTSADWAICRCSKPRMLLAYWNYPDLGYQFSTRIAFISFAIGLLGLAVGLIDLIHNWA